MKIYLYDLTGKTHELDVEPSDPISNLPYKIGISEE
jgi:hypothetical protein